MAFFFLDKTNSEFSAFIIKRVRANRFRHTTAMLGHHLNKMAVNLPKNGAPLLLTKPRCIPTSSLITALQ